MRWMGLVFVTGCLAVLTACGPHISPVATKVQRADESGIAIMAEFDAPNVRPIAQSHCRKFGKHAVVEDASPVGDSFKSDWVFGVKPYLFSYSCI